MIDQGGGDVMSEEITVRRDELLVKLRANEISKTEAIELGKILAKDGKEAEERTDAKAQVAIARALGELAFYLGRHK